MFVCLFQIQLLQVMRMETVHVLGAAALVGALRAGVRLVLMDIAGH